MGTVLDLHVHSAFSQDSPVEPEKYLEQLAELKKNYHVDGLCFCEHRNYQADFNHRALAQKYGAMVFAGVEAETRWGHILVFCPDLNWFGKQDLRVKLEPLKLAEDVESRGGIIIPAHPFRGMISLRENVRNLPNLHALEALNGSNLPEENLLAKTLAEELGLAQTGGSDAHFVNEFARSLTEFEAEINSVEEMIAEIKARRVRPIWISEAKI
jgi:predicted metal-dependent phosphoesterase TrpH